MERIVLITAVILALLGATALWLATKHAEHGRNLSSQGVTVDAEIVAKFIANSAEKNRMVGDQKPASTQVEGDYVRYRFPLEDGTLFEKEEAVGPEFYEQAEIGSVWQVTYLPEDPEIVSLYGQRFHQSGVHLNWIAGLALLVSLLLFGYRFRRPLRTLFKGQA